MKHLYNGKAIIESGTLMMGIGCRAANSKASRNHQNQSLKKQHFCRHENIKRFMLFTLQPKSASELRC